MPKRQSGNKKGKQSTFAKLSIFQPNKYKFKKTCPLSVKGCLLYTSPSPRDQEASRMPSSA